MKKLIDKFGAIWCILTRKEYVVFACDEFDDPYSGKCWVSYGVHNRKDKYSIFIKANIEYLNSLLNEKYIRKRKVW